MTSDKEVEPSPTTQSDLPLTDISALIGGRPSGGWLKFIRKLAGLTTVQFGEMRGQSAASITMLERGECNGSISLRRLADVAHRLDCSLVYALVPNDPIMRERLIGAVKQSSLLPNDFHSSAPSPANEGAIPEGRFRVGKFTYCPSESRTLHGPKEVKLSLTQARVLNKLLEARSNYWLSIADLSMSVFSEVRPETRNVIRVAVHDLGALLNSGSSYEVLRRERGSGYALNAQKIA
jgi:transcriptional regulator with XRE-family HTH domain